MLKFFVTINAAFHLLIKGVSIIMIFVYYFIASFYNTFYCKSSGMVEEGYQHNPYHNATHAADVTQAMHCYITQGKVR